MSKQIPLLREGEMPYQPSPWFHGVEQDGSWRYLRPGSKTRSPLANEGCPAGQDIEGPWR